MLSLRTVTTFTHFKRQKAWKGIIDKWNFKLNISHQICERRAEYSVNQQDGPRLVVFYREELTTCRRLSLGIMGQRTHPKKIVYKL